MLITLFIDDAGPGPKMSTVVLCCNTLEDEIRRALDDTGLDYPVIWLEAGLHNQPERLRSRINEVLAGITDAGRVLMALGHCGGACAGLINFDYELIIPKADDCLSLLLGSMEKRQRVSRSCPTYFLTAGWLRHTENLITSFSRDCGFFGREKAERVYRVMLKHYRRLGFIDTGAYDPAEEESKISSLAGMVGLKTERLAGDLVWLKRLLTGPWDGGDFIVVKPRACLSSAAWNWLGGSAILQL